MASDSTSYDDVAAYEVPPKPADKSKIQKLWKIALVLGVVTIIEFIFAFTMPRGPLLIFIFIALTLVKAFYIVSEFMHLKHETKVLIWSVVIPFIFIVWLIIALLVEGGTLFALKF